MSKTNEYRAGMFRFWAVAIAVTALMMAGTPASAGKPLKVVILAGQSNMQKPAGWRTLAGLADTPETKPLYDKLVDENGKVRVYKDVYETIFNQKTKDENGNDVVVPGFGSPLPYTFGGQILGTDEKVGGSFGPELGFGVTLYEEQQEPILIIKTAWGGKSLYKDFRPPIGTEWQPPKGHPEHPDYAPEPLPIPATFELPSDFQPPTGRGKNMQIFSGLPLDEMKGVYPIYVLSGYDYKGELKSIPLEAGDLILGVNGAGLGEDPVNQWRNAWFNKAREGDWTISITRWRAGHIDTFTIDTAKTMKGGRKGADEYTAQKNAEEKKLIEEGGQYYGMMIKRIKEVLDDPGRFHPAYDPKLGVEIAGFVWFQGYNDYISSVTYPYDYAQYSWLLAHLIRHVRKDINAPMMPVVIGVFGQGGKLETPDPFREAQAAVADYDEFKGNVVAVRTAQFYDARIPELQGKLDRVMQYKGDDPNHPYAKLQAKIRDYKEGMGDPDKLEGKRKYRLIAKIKKGIDDVVKTDEEKAYLENNVSNRGFHYDGSPKFFVRAGEAFAKALSEMIK